jgi:hypothetical protein
MRLYVVLIQGQLCDNALCLYVLIGVMSWEGLTMQRSSLLLVLKGGLQL